MLPFAVNVMLNLSNIRLATRLARCKMIITNSELCIFLVSYHFIFSMPLENNDC